ncbi:MAG: ABC transporter permease subunit [Anaerolineae bacterium]|jgi:iron(III) transport system permease protein|nr:ABC transporter permease subunit [Anaerolineae bacterium]
MTKSPDLRPIARLIIFGAVVLSPLLALVIACCVSLLQGHADWLLLALPTGRRLSLLLRSLGLSAGVALIDMVLGILIACASWGWDRRWAWMRWLPLVLIALPPYIHALAWSAIVQQLSALLDVPQPDGLLLSLWVMAMALLPVGIGLALLSLETVARPLVDAARTRQDDLTVLWRVILPLAGPLLAAGAGLIFVLSLMDYSVPSLFGVNVYALEIFAEFSASNQPVRAFLLSMPLLVLAAGGLFAGQVLLRHAAQVPVWGVSPWSTPPRWENGFALCQSIAVALWGAQVLIPLIVLVKLTFSGDGWVGTLGPAVREFSFSFGVAAATALLSLPLGWLALEFFTHRSRHHAAIGWLLFLPVALPAPLVGIGLVALWNHPSFDGIYATAWMPVLAALARFAPLAALVLLAQSRQLDPLLWDAARIFQARDRQTTWRVRLPLLLPGLLAGASLVFALTLGELGATLIVAPPGQSTLTLRIYNYLHYGASDVVAGLCLAMLLLTLAAGGLGVFSLATWSRRTSLPEQP